MTAINDVTGHKIETKKTNDNYRSNYDKIFGSKDKNKEMTVEDLTIDQCRVIVKEVLHLLEDNNIQYSLPSLEQNIGLYLYKLETLK